MSAKTKSSAPYERLGQLNRGSIISRSGGALSAAGALSIADATTLIGVQLNKGSASHKAAPIQYHPTKRRKTMTKKTGIIMAAMVMLGTLGANPAVAEDGPTDMQIAHIVYTADNIDIGYAELALAKSDNPKVREFANLMLRDHIAVNERALALLDKLGATPEDNPTSQQLIANAKAKTDELAALDGIAFDRAYAENELGYHQFVNETVETVFIPAVDNEEFKALLKSSLLVFKVHENHAAKMVAALN